MLRQHKVALMKYDERRATVLGERLMVAGMIQHMIVEDKTCWLMVIRSMSRI